MPDNIAGVSAAEVPVSGPFIFALDAPLRRTGDEDRIGRRAEVRVPDVTGSSLRAAANRLHEAGFRVQISGSGRVESMDPEPGSRLRKGKRVRLIGDER
jgi:hypothetical protein